MEATTGCTFSSSSSSALLTTELPKMADPRSLRGEAFPLLLFTSHADRERSGNSAGLSEVQGSRNEQFLWA